MSNDQGCGTAAVSSEDAVSLVSPLARRAPLHLPEHNTEDTAWFV